MGSRARLRLVTQLPSPAHSLGARSRHPYCVPDPRMRRHLLALPGGVVKPVLSRAAAPVGASAAASERARSCSAAVASISLAARGVARLDFAASLVAVLASPHTRSSSGFPA